MQFFNTLTRTKEPFIPIQKGQVSMYSCGPTVYNYAHLGNLRAFVFVDVLKRYLRYKGFAVKHVMNVTDVDDKTIKGSGEEGKSLKEFCDFYEKAFLEDLKALHIIPPDIMPRATEHIGDMAAIIKKLEEKGIAYERDGSMYFKISKDTGYGKLAMVNPDTLKKNAEGRLSDEYEKDDARDFALWKAYAKEDGDVFWENALPKGRPGWHIECSAMSMKYLGEHFDIHTGGVDLIFPHHTNEIAQSECSTGKKFVNYWLHNAHLIVNGEKMSKSKGNFYTLRDLLGKGYGAHEIRFELLCSHYRQELDFREANLKNSPLEKIRELLMKLDRANGSGSGGVNTLISQLKNDFEEAMDDDLNIAGALAALFVFTREVNKRVEQSTPDEAKDIKKALLDIDTVLGVMDFKDEKVPKEIYALAEQRAQAKKAKDWKKADELREQIKSKGYWVQDSRDGYLIQKA